MSYLSGLQSIIDFFEHMAEQMRLNPNRDKEQLHIIISTHGDHTTSSIPVHTQINRIYVRSSTSTPKGGKISVDITLEGRVAKTIEGGGIDVGSCLNL